MKINLCLKMSKKFYWKFISEIQKKANQMYGMIKFIQYVDKVE